MAQQIADVTLQAFHSCVRRHIELNFADIEIHLAGSQSWRKTTMNRTGIF